MDDLSTDELVLEFDLARIVFAEEEEEEEEEASYIISLKDVTESKRAEEALRKSEARYHQLLDAMTEAVYVLDTKWNYLLVNKQAAQVVQMQADEMINRNLFDLFPDLKKTAFCDAMQHSMEECVRKQVVDKFIINQRETWYELKIWPVPDGLLCISADITERKQLELALTKTQTQIQAVMNSTDDMIWSVDPVRFGLLTFNQGLKRYFKERLNVDCQIGMTPAELLPSDFAVQWHEIYARALQEGSFATEYLTSSGVNVWMLTVNLMKQGNDVFGISVFSKDITERKLAEGRLKTSQEQLHLLAGHLHSVREEERKHLAQEFHDQLGQTLTAIKMDLSMLHRAIADPGKEPSRSVIAQGIESSQDMIDRAIAIIREILSELRPELLDQLGIVPTLEWEVEKFQRKSGISSTFSSSVEQIALDASKAIALYRIFQEAITNVARHAKATSVVVSLRKEGPYLVLEIEDNGVGISADVEQRARSFGLIGMRERAILLGGTVEIRGVEGKGTTVLVQIPVEQTLVDGGAAL